MIRNLYIHIGTHKTGTTAIQHFLYNNRKVLEEKNFHYPDFIVRIPGLDWAKQMSHNLAWHLGFGNGPSAAAARDIDTAFFLEQVAGRDNVVLSSEVFCENVTPDNLSRLAWFLDEVKVENFVFIIYLRRQDLFLESAYQQVVKQGRFWKNISELTSHLEDRFYALDRYAERFGKPSIRVRVYEQDQFQGGNIFTDFFSLLNLEVTDNLVRPKPAQANIGWDTTLISIKRIVNRCLEEEDERKHMQEGLQRYFESCVLGQKKAYRLLAMNQRLAILREWASWNAMVTRDYLHRTDGRLFRDPVPDSEEVASGLSPGGLSQEEVQTLAEHLQRRNPAVFERLIFLFRQAAALEEPDIQTTAEVLLAAFQETAEKV